MVSSALMIMVETPWCAAWAVEGGENLLHEGLGNDCMGTSSSNLCLSLTLQYGLKVSSWSLMVARSQDRYDSYTSLLAPFSVGESYSIQNCDGTKPIRWNTRFLLHYAHAQ